VFSRDELADSWVSLVMAVEIKELVLETAHSQMLYGPSFFPFFGVLLHLGYLWGEGQHVIAYHESFFSKLMLTAWCWLRNIVLFHIRLTRL